MNYRKHAENSATIFGGIPEDYFEIHKTINGGEISTTSPYGNFYLHHYDVGGVILEGLFGCKIGNVPVKNILLQHLIEDYGQVPLFKDWIRNGGTMPLNCCVLKPFKKDGDFEYVKKRLLEKGYKNINTRTIRKIEGLLTLRYFTNDKEILNRPDSPMNCCVFGHATGIYLAERFLGREINGYDTLDLLKAYYDIRFQKVPSISDYIEWWIEEKNWMKWVDLTSAHFDYINSPIRVKKQMIKIIGENSFGIKDIEFPTNTQGIPSIFENRISNQQLNAVYGPVKTEN